MQIHQSIPESEISWETRRTSFDFMNPSGLPDAPDLAGTLADSGGPSRRRSHESKAGLTKTKAIEEAEKTTKSMSAHFFWKKLHLELGFAISAAPGEPSSVGEIGSGKLWRVAELRRGGGWRAKSWTGTGMEPV